MDNLYIKIENLCRQHNINLTKMCKDLNIPRSTFSDYKAGRRKSISLKYCVQIAAYFNVPVDSLTDTPKIKTTSAETRIERLLESPIRKYDTINLIIDKDNPDNYEKLKRIMNTTDEKKVYVLSEDEFKLIIAYRSHPEVQQVIKKILDISKD